MTTRGSLAPGAPGSDILVFGGRDSNTGQLSNELWLLRSYSGTVSSSNDKWSGFGNGKLQSGIAASGTGVMVQFLTPSCPSIAASPSSSSTPSPSSTILPVPSTTFSYDASALHRGLSPASVALFLPAYLLFRMSGVSLRESPTTTLSPFRIGILSLLFGSAAYGLGVAGFALSLTTTKQHDHLLSKRAFSRGTFLKTTHGAAGFGLFICLHAALPIAIYLSARSSRRFVGERSGSLASDPDTKTVDGGNVCCISLYLIA